ncbi:hypothetical protein [Geodermatophilus sp. CPCC 205761]|uniref:hypothetical protein n=1 Tax=Geodermatophilus sp. CPCC 205761 TaxID=2936597 RepID=UPI003EEC35CD
MTKSGTAERAAQALELHLAGAGYDRIAAVLGYANRGGAYKAVQAALAARPAAPEHSEVIAVELARLDALLTGLWPKARRGDVQAVDRVLKIDERRAELRALVPRPAPAADSPADPLDELRARRDHKREDRA